jgi:hypothetical protein
VKRKWKVSWALGALESILGIRSLTEGRTTLKNWEIPLAVAVILMKF